MGNQASRVGPVSPAEIPDAVVKSPLGGSRFLRTHLCLHDEGGLVVFKSYRRLDTDGGTGAGATSSGAGGLGADVRQYEEQLLAARTALAAVPRPHVWPTQRVYRTEAAVHLARQYMASTLAARITSRPFLTPAERRWLGRQVVAALAQAHAAGVCHGDVKAENMLLTSWGWALLADFAPYKPTMLPADNPADYSFFFDTSARRKCYLAPERFYDPGPSLPPLGAPLTPAMDVFAAGCVLAELFADGEPLFDYSRLLAYRRGEYDPASAIAALGTTEPGIATLVAHMTQLDPKLRHSAADYVIMYDREVMAATGRAAVPAVVEPFIGDLLGLEADIRAEVVAEGYPALRAELLGEKREGEIGEEAPGTPPPSRDAEPRRSEAGGIDEEGAGPGYAPDQLQAQAAAMLAEARAAVAGLSDAASSSGSAASNRGGSVGSRRQSLDSPPQKTTSLASSTAAARATPPTTSAAAPAGEVNDGLVVVLTLLCAVLRGSRRQAVRVRLIEAIADCAAACGDDEARLQTAVPHLVAAAADPQFAAVRCAALRALPRVLAAVATVPPGDARAFSDYLLPSLSLLPADTEASVQAGYAGVLASVASESRAALEKVETASVDATSAAAAGPQRYDEELGRLRGGVERAVHDLLVGARPEPKLALLPHLGELSAVLGRRDAADGLLPALLTLFNSREWQVRAALYRHLAGVCPVLGPQGVAFLMPFLDRMLGDPEPAAVAGAADLLAALCRAGLLRQRHVLAAAAKVAESGLLRSECTAVRAAAANFAAAAAAALPGPAGQALLLPLLRPQLERDPAPLDEVEAVAAALAPRAFKPAKGTAAAVAPMRPPSSAAANATAAGEGAAAAPTTSYSVMLDPKHLRKGTSWLSAALKQAAAEAGGSGGGAASDGGGVPLLVATAQRNVAHSTMPGLEGPPVPPRRRAAPAAATAAPPATPAGTATSAPPWRPRGVLVAHLAEHKRQVTRVAAVPGTSLFLSASEDGAVKIWDTRRLERDISFRPRASYDGHGSWGVRAVAALPDGATVVSGGADGSVHSWRLERGPDGEGWGVGGASAILDGRDGASGGVIDLAPWGSDAAVVSRVAGGIAALDLRAPPHAAAWRLPVQPSRGMITRVCCDPSETAPCWLVTGTSRGGLAVWDARFLLPVATWTHPRGASVDALALGGSAGAPLVWAAAGKDEAVAWNVSAAAVEAVVRIRGRGEVAGVTPEALSAPPPAVGGAGDPLARARALGAGDLRTLAARRPGFRALLAAGGPLLTGGTDCAVRCWDAGDAGRSYVVAAPPPEAAAPGPPQWSYSSRRVGATAVVEEECVDAPAEARRGAGAHEADEKRRLGARWAAGAAALAHQQSVVDLARVEGQSEPLLVSASLDGVVKVWR